MNSFPLRSISNKLLLLVLLAVLPALAIFLYTGLEQRQNSIAAAKRDVLLLTHSMAEVQQNLAISTRQMLSTLALLPEVQAMNIPACGELFRQLIEKNPEYNNIALTDIHGEVLAASRAFSEVNLADRKHIREALQTKSFAAGEYIVSRVGVEVPVFPFASPVLDSNGQPKAVLTVVLKLDHISHYLDDSPLPDKSFVSITDHQGIRLAYFPAQKDTNPVGKPIKDSSWQAASNQQGQGIFINTGSDGIRRIFAFEQVRLTAHDPAYLYVWAGIPESHILAAANATLSRNLLLMLLVTLLALFLAWLVGNRTVIVPINKLVVMTREYARGNLEARLDHADTADEFGILTRAFHDMAASLSNSQTALRENEARFRLIMDSLDALVYVADMDTYEVLFINRYGRQLFGEVVGQLCWQHLQLGQTGPCPFCTNKYLLAEDGTPGEIYTWEFQNTTTGRWFFIHDRAIKWVDGRIVRLEIATDITERKQAETRLAEESERLAVTLRSIGDGVITTDTQGQILLINQVAEMLTGWTSTDATGRSLTEVFDIHNVTTGAPCDNPLGKILAAGEVTSLADGTVLMTKNGQQRRIADSGAPIRDKAGQVIGFVLVFRDITNQLRTEQELVKVKKLESVGVLAGGIAHDFNNILAAILGNMELSLRDATLSEKTRRRLDQALKASHRASDLTQQLLTFAKGGQPIKATAALTEVVKDSADFILRGGKVACRYRFADDLWLVDIDKGQISQVVQNVILNASNAMPEGGIIEVSCRNVRSPRSLNIALPKDGNYVELKITDTGVGIPEQLLDKIFDPYFSTKQQGSGLGLAITHSIISKHDGQISVQSTLGAGTSFSIYLPASLQSSIPNEKGAAAEMSRKTGRILIMDDEELVREVTQEMLHEMGYEVLLAKDGQEAVQLYQNALQAGAPIDVTIMDLTIPGGMGGKDAVQEILAIDPAAQVIVSSGYSTDPVMAHFQDYGFCAAIAKPHQFAKLNQLIHQLIE